MMLSINRITNIRFGSGMHYTPVDSSKYSKSDKFSNYIKMNQPVYQDYVAGDISLLDLLSDKLDALWNVLNRRNPNLELKAKIIKDDWMDKYHNLSSYGMVA